MPPPEHDEYLYNIQELVLHFAELDENCGIKRIIADLRSSNRCIVSPAAFLRAFKKYKQSSRLPDKDDFGGTFGRRPIIITSKITSELNVKNTIIYHMLVTD